MPKKLKAAVDGTQFVVTELLTSLQSVDLGLLVSQLSLLSSKLLMHLLKHVPFIRDPVRSVCNSLVGPFDSRMSFFEPQHHDDTAKSAASRGLLLLARQLQGSQWC